jgi:hypothetical protein
MIYREYSRAARAEGRLASARARSEDVKTSLDHLPPGKRAELTYVVDVLRESFAAEIATRQSPALRAGAILKIVLFGS